MAPSKTILIFGGNGKTARALTPLLIGQSHLVHSIIRNPDQSSGLEELGTKVIIQDLEQASVKDLTSTIESIKPDVLVWCAQGTYGVPGGAEAIDHQAAVRSFDAAAVAGLKRYISVSALDVRDRANKPTPPWYSEQDKQGSERLWKVLEPYMEAKLKADRELASGNRKRGLSWTIVRPGRLVDDAGSGRCEAGRVHFGKPISREDVARVVLACIEKEGTAELAFDVVGGDIDVNEAVRNVAEKKEDCFEGFY
ncbi:hypothetical protein LTR70_003930 [Exophiala xenobiotica]|uniref:NAD(P)-binding domain-containing protein n=1 Tax=Lithohypha guttulata TaxID=1690604 RepID=A0ABR0K9V1_9EURO|nr:hypothetical protein LTR24_005306 [Lithohypha guttulata]KAK5322083.1 hypothetical protein LTR70_003930 [Exophiala xenobiotica]